MRNSSVPLFLRYIILRQAQDAEMYSFHTFTLIPSFGRMLFASTMVFTSSLMPPLYPSIFILSFIRSAWLRRPSAERASLM